MKIIYLDTETTGRDAKLNDVTQIAGIIEIDGEVKEEFNITCQPVNWDAVEPEALTITGKTLDDLKAYQMPAMAYSELIGILGKYVDKFNRNDKFTIIGYNVRFDIDFMSNFFIKRGDKYFGSWFSWRSVDLLMLMDYLKYRGICDLPDHKLGTVCGHFNVEINAHDALSDIRATMQLTKKIDSRLIYQDSIL